MKILITSDFSLPIISGVVNVVESLKKGLEKDGHDVRILTFTKKKKSYYNNDNKTYFFKSLKVQFYKDSLNGINIFDSLMKDIYKWNPDIIHSQTEFFSMRYAKKISQKTKCPIIHTWHTNFNAYCDYFIGGKSIYFFILKKLLNNSLKYPVLKVIAPSQSTKDMIKNEFNINLPVEVIPSGIDLKKFITPLDKLEKEALFKKYGFNKNKFRFITVARLAEEKNIDQMIKYFSKLHKRINNIQYIIVGDGPQRNKLENLATDLGLNLNIDIIFCGSIKPLNIPKYYKCSNIFINGSEKETQGLTYFEALASNLPIVCKKNPVLDKILIQSYNGYSFTNEENFLNILENIINNKDLYTYLVNNTYNSIKEYSQSNYIIKLFNNYNFCISEYKKNNILQ